MRNAGAGGEQELGGGFVKKGAKKKTRASEEPEIDAKFAPVVQAFAKVADVEAGKLFSSYGLKANGKIFAMFGRGRFVVKLPKERVDEFVKAKRAKRFEPGPGRVMKEWAAFKDAEDEWVSLAREAYRFVKRIKSEDQG